MRKKSNDNIKLSKSKNSEINFYTAKNNDGSDENASSMDSSDDNSDDSVESGPDLDTLPISMFIYSMKFVTNYFNVFREYPNLKLISDCNEIQTLANQATTSLIKNRMVILEMNSNLTELLNKSRKRKRCDFKIPPGSKAVNRTLFDNRYLLSIICIEIGKIFYSLGDISNAYEYYLESLLWYPRSCHGNFYTARLLKSTIRNQYDLDKIEHHLRKATLIDNIVLNGESRMESGNALESVEDQSLESMVELRNIEISILKEEIEAGKEAIQELCLFLYQNNKVIQADGYLRKLGYEWKLATKVLAYPLPIDCVATNEIELMSTTSKSVSNADSHSSYLHVTDNALPLPIIQHLQQIFRPTSPFWSEHQYDSLSNASRTVGYFSYLYPFRQRTSSTTIEQIIDYLYPKIVLKFPDVNDCNIAEWWVHTRPHCSGHQLHFDSDETCIEDGGQPAHPVASVVIYCSDIGGPTLITDQILTGGGKLATRGWLCHPKLNRMAVFNARYLHGVLPGRGIPPGGNTSTTTGTTTSNEETDGGNRFSDIREQPPPRRLTFMVGFWKSINARSRGLDSPGPGQPLPDPLTSRYKWIQEMKIIQNHWIVDGDTNSAEYLTPVDVSPVAIAPIWEPVGAGNLDEDASGLSRKVKVEELVTTPSYNACFQGF